MKIAFASDLHLNKEKDWTLNVLKELVEKTKDFSNILILGGDLFDSFNDLIALKDFFVSVVENSPIKKVFFVPGNHDIKGGTLEDLSKINFGSKVSCFTRTPYSIVSLDDEEMEFLIIPFQKDLSSLYNKDIYFSKRFRIVIGHGSIIDFNNDMEDENSFFDTEFFNLVNAKIVFLGHIHNSNLNQRKIERKIIYPGSARIWRKGEDGDHGFIVYDTKTDEVIFNKLESGGMYKRINIEIEKDNYFIDNSIFENLPKNCFLEIIFKGIVYSDNSIENIKGKIRQILEEKSIINKDDSSLFNTENVIKATNYYNLEIFKAFMEKWKNYYSNETDEDEKENYLLARKLFIEELSQFLIGGGEN